MNEQDWLAERFEQHRPRLRAVSYRMLGSLTDADDAVQETWLRVSRADTSQVDDLGAWLTTVVARICLNALRSRAARHEELTDTHVPDPIISRDSSGLSTCMSSASYPRRRPARSRSSSSEPSVSNGRSPRRRQPSSGDETSLRTAVTVAASTNTTTSVAPRRSVIKLAPAAPASSRGHRVALPDSLERTRAAAPPAPAEG
jgi:RNA polymerase sigma factor (sigma-70 family)